MDETHDCHGKHHYEATYVARALFGPKQLTWKCKHCGHEAGGILTIGPEGFDT